VSGRHIGVAVVLLVASLARPAVADDPPFTIGSQPTWLLLGGVTAGSTFAPDTGALVGGELSFARLRDASFAGVYGDAYYDWAAHGTYATAGIELGHKYVGLDGGVALRFADGTDVGATARITLGIGVVGVYARYAHFWDAMTAADVVQVGVMVKLPLWTGGL
jgi:hypothetical protein